MKIGFSGSHRTGKTTLARSVAQELGVAMLETSVSSAPIWNQIHVSPSEQFTFAERLEVQHRLMEYLEKRYANATEKNFIADRTPLDLLGYLFANVDNTCSDLWTESARSLIEKAYSLVTRHFDKIFLVQPGIPAVSDTGKSGKVFMSAIYQTAINNNIMAFGINYADPSKFIIIPANIIDFNERVEYVLERV
jgi:hypothetical protein